MVKGLSSAGVTKSVLFKLLKWAFIEFRIIEVKLGNRRPGVEPSSFIDNMSNL